MPRAPTRAETRRRVEAIRADRAAGQPFREIARRHGVSHQFAFWSARHVTVAYVHRRWHLARWRPDPPPVPAWQVLPWARV